MLSIVVCSPVARLINASLRWYGFFSFRSLSCCASETPTAIAIHFESAENAGVAPKATVFVVPSATLATRRSFSPSVRLIA